MIYTDSDYDYPTIDRVISIDNNYETIRGEIEETILRYEKLGFSTEQCIEICRDMFGNESIISTDKGFGKEFTRNSYGKVESAKGNSRENEVKQRGIAPTKETKFSIKNEKLENEMDKLGKNVPKKDLKGETIEDRWIAERTDSNKVKDVKIGDLKRFIEDKFEIPVNLGKTPKNAKGIYKVKGEVIRTKIENNLPTISHERVASLSLRVRAPFFCR